MWRIILLLLVVGAGLLALMLGIIPAFDNYFHLFHYGLVFVAMIIMIILAIWIHRVFIKK